MEGDLNFTSIEYQLNFSVSILSSVSFFPLNSLYIFLCVRTPLSVLFFLSVFFLFLVHTVFVLRSLFKATSNNNKRMLARLIALHVQDPFCAAMWCLVCPRFEHQFLHPCCHLVVTHTPMHAQARGSPFLSPFTYL